MSDEPPASWPHGVQPIRIGDLKRLGIDSERQLYWDGRAVEIRRPLDLTKLQKLFAIVVAIFAVLGGIGGFATGFNDASVFLCARGHDFLSCPLPLPGRP
jgi:hypothetical protein